MDGSKPEWKDKNKLWITFKDPEFHIMICLLNNWFVPKCAEPYPECKSNRMISSVGWDPLFPELTKRSTWYPKFRKIHVWVRPQVQLFSAASSLSYCPLPPPPPIPSINRGLGRKRRSFDNKDRLCFPSCHAGLPLYHWNRNKEPWGEMVCWMFPDDQGARTNP